MITIIVAVKNESDNIENCLECLLFQNYPKDLLEVIVVDDYSTDNTAQIVKQIVKKSKNLILLQYPPKKEWKSTKKQALQYAVEKARGKILLLTDADCLPPRQWALKIVECFDKDTGIVVGFAPQYSNRKWWSGFLFLDSLSAAFVSSASVGKNKGVTCTGRNMAYRKKAFSDVGGYTELSDTLSGDDDFLLQRISAHPNWKARYSFDVSTVVRARGPANFISFINQKTRHISAGQNYSFFSKMGYMLFHALNFAIWVNILFVFLFDWKAVFVLILKCMVDFIFLSIFSQKFCLRVEINHFLLWEILFPAYHLIAGLFSFFKVRW